MGERELLLPGISATGAAGPNPEAAVARIQPPGFVLPPADGERFLRRIGERARWFPVKGGRPLFLALFREGIFPGVIVGEVDPRTGEVLGVIGFARKGNLPDRTVPFWVPPEGAQVSDKALEPLFQQLEREFQKNGSSNPKDGERMNWRWGPWLEFASRLVDQLSAGNSRERRVRQALDWACERFEGELVRASNQREIEAVVNHWEPVFEKINQHLVSSDNGNPRPVVFLGEGAFPAYLRIL